MNAIVGVILLCAGSVPPEECRGANVERRIEVPGTFTNPMLCFLHAQAFMARSPLAQDGDSFMIVCQPGGRT